MGWPLCSFWTSLGVRKMEAPRSSPVLLVHSLILCCAIVDSHLHFLVLLEFECFDGFQVFFSGFCAVDSCVDVHGFCL